MSECMLSENYREFMDIQHKLKKARKKNDSEKIAEFVKALQEPASKLTEFEQDYAEWVLDLYEDNIHIDEIKKEIKKLSAELKADKVAKRASVWDVPRTYTRLCALRAAMRGRLHFSPNTSLNKAYYELCLPLKNVAWLSINPFEKAILDLEVQKEWVTDIVDKFVEEKIIPVEQKLQITKQPQPLWKQVVAKVKNIF